MAEIKQAKFIDQTGQEKDAVFIGAERAIFDDNGKRLDQKLDEMKKATGLVATDKNGLVGGSGEEVSLQALIDGVSNRIINELVTNATLTQTLAIYMTKALMSNVQVNDSGKVPTSALAYAMQQAITKNKEDVAKLNSEGPFVYSFTSNEVLSGSEWEYHGIKITIPSGYMAIIVAQCDWNNVKPIGIAISDSDSKLNAKSITVLNKSDEILQYHIVTATGFLGEGEYYIWSKNEYADGGRVSERARYSLFKIK